VSVAVLVGCGASKAPVSPAETQAASASASAAPSASSAPVPGPSASAASPGASSGAPDAANAPTVFRCATEQRPVGLRVEERFATRAIPIDVNGQEVGAMELADATNVYTLKSLAYEGPFLNRVEVVLQSHVFAPGAASFPEQDRWQKALTGGWLKLTQPFVIERHAEVWCFAERKCPAAGSPEREFLGALGAIVVMMMPLEKLQARFDRQPSDGTLTLDWSDTAAEMVGEKNAPKLLARQVGTGIPAKLEVTSERSNVVVKSAATASTKLPRKSSKAAKLVTVDRFTVDRDCRLRELELTIAADYSLVPNTKSAIRMVQFHGRKLTPE